jgi:transposase-like protein
MPEQNTPFYVVMGVTTDGERGIAGIWAGDGAEGARFWQQVFSAVDEPWRRGRAHRRL